MKPIERKNCNLCAYTRTCNAYKESRKFYDLFQTYYWSFDETDPHSILAKDCEEFMWDVSTDINAWISYMTWDQEMNRMLR